MKQFKDIMKGELKSFKFDKHYLNFIQLIYLSG